MVGGVGIDSISFGGLRTGDYVLVGDGSQSFPFQYTPVVSKDGGVASVMARIQTKGDPERLRLCEVANGEPMRSWHDIDSIMSDSGARSRLSSGKAWIVCDGRLYGWDRI